MRIVLKLLKWVLLLLTALALTAFVLPEARHVERSREIAVPPDQVWPLIAEPRRWNDWQPWLAKDPAMHITYSGPDRGAGAQWAWKSETEGEGRMKFEHAEPPRLLQYRLEFVDMGSTATGQFRLEPAGAGTRVTWTFDTRLGANPVMRWFGLMLDRVVGADFEAGLDRLARRATRVTP
jgi:uncharacterized protein YndB with AHSA1/START domain